MGFGPQACGLSPSVLNPAPALLRLLSSGTQALPPPLHERHARRASNQDWYTARGCASLTYREAHIVRHYSLNTYTLPACGAS